VRVRVKPELASALRALARRRSISVSQALRSVIAQEIRNADRASGSTPDESAIRETAILVAVELVIKLQEASIPGGVTLSRRLVEDAARAAIDRIQLVEARLQENSAQ